jgi:hypothetical protein
MVAEYTPAAIGLTGTVAEPAVRLHAHPSHANGFHILKVVRAGKSASMTHDGLSPPARGAMRPH